LSRAKRVLVVADAIRILPPTHTAAAMGKKGE
jgi:hypothetical protein